MAFPSSPTGGQQYTQDGRTWQWDGVAWEVLAVPGPTGPAGAPGVVAATAPLAYNSGTQTVSIDLSAYSTTAAANGLYYPLSGNPSGFLTSAPVTSVAGRTGAITLSNTDISGLGTMATETASNYPQLGSANTFTATNTFTSPTLTFGNTTAASTVNIGTGATLSATTKAINIGTGGVAGSNTIITVGSTAGLTNVTFNTNGGQVYFPGNVVATTQPANTSDTTLATTAFVVGQAGSATPIVNGTAAVGTSLRYARQDHVHGTDTTRAAVDSQVFTGTPTLPTGTIATTQIAGNNTTAVATTAFVTAATPAASTTVVGLVELATSEEAILGASTTLAPTAFAGKAAIMSSDWSPIYRNGFTATVSGTGANAILGFTNTQYQMPTLGAVAGHSYGRTFGTSQIDQLTNIWGDDANIYVNFAKRIWISGRSLLNFPNEAVYVARVSFGKAEGTGVGDLAARGIGWKYIAGASNFVQLMVHNGTTLTTVNSSFHPTTSPFSWDIVSDGSGNVTLYINGSSVATTASGPSTRAVSTQCLYQEEAVLTATSTGNFLRFYCARGAIYVQR